MLFTHDGIGGPAALDLSRFVTDFLPSEKNTIKIFIDLISDIDETELENLILNQSSKHPKKTVANILTESVPRRVLVALCGQLDFPADLYANQLSKKLRRKLLHLIKAMPLSITRTRPIDEATVTRGGVNVTEIEPKTMESLLCPGLFFAGEVIDVDGPCGGYNLQICWSTGALAGLSAGQTK
jgi:predicted Rossmann fold flavoprotein